jgi:hypothetical protein
MHVTYMWLWVTEKLSWGRSIPREGYLNADNSNGFSLPLCFSHRRVSSISSLEGLVADFKVFHP